MKQVDEDPSLLSVITTAFSNAPHTLQVHVRPKAIGAFDFSFKNTGVSKAKNIMTKQASQIQVLTLQLEDASCQLDRSCCVDINHPSIGWMLVEPVSESPILLSQRPNGYHLESS